jgi:hypothetical protein
MDYMELCNQLCHMYDYEHGLICSHKSMIWHVMCEIS